LMQRPALSSWSMRRQPVQSICKRNVPTHRRRSFQPTGRKKIHADGAAIVRKIGRPDAPTSIRARTIATACGQYPLTQNAPKIGQPTSANLTILYDLARERGETLLYVSTGTGPANEQPDPRTFINEQVKVYGNLTSKKMTKQAAGCGPTASTMTAGPELHALSGVHSHNAIDRFALSAYGSGCTRVGGRPVARSTGCSALMECAATSRRSCRHRHH
jgi:hypothetical protein